jgi:hypothetical protein
MMDAPGNALLGQILAEVRSVGAKVSGVEITVAQAVAEIQHRAGQTEDHETRIRALERIDPVTAEDLAASQDKRQAKQRTWIAMALTVFGFVETAAIALLVRGS